jgi:putative flippase GtrA
VNQVIRFLLGGGAGVLAYYAVLYGLTEWCGVWYIASAGVAWVVNWTLNFTIQKFWTFRNRDRATVRRQLLCYFLMALGFLVTATTALYALVEWGGLHYLVAQVLIMTVTSTISFFVTRRIFRPKEDA